MDFVSRANTHSQHTHWAQAQAWVSDEVGACSPQSWWLQVQPFLGSSGSEREGERTVGQAAGPPLCLDECAFLHFSWVAGKLEGAVASQLPPLWFPACTLINPLQGYNGHFLLHASEGQRIRKLGDSPVPAIILQSCTMILPTNHTGPSSFLAFFHSGT